MPEAAAESSLETPSSAGLHENGEEYAPQNLSIVIPIGDPTKIRLDEGEIDSSETQKFRCRVCEDLTSNPNSNSPMWHQRSLAELEDGERAGCRYCELLKKGIRACVPESEFQNDSLLSQRLAKVLPQKTGLGSSNKYGVSAFKLNDDEFIHESAIRVGTVPSGDTGSSHAIQTAQSWLRDCVSNHKSCLEEEMSSPTRLVRVSVCDSQDVQLVELSGQPCEYATLSHCWGETAANKTTIASLTDFLSCIPWASLCATYRDAIKVTRRLGIEYIWIDSLCIVQDSDEDWQRESASMARIYQGSLLTIAATRSPSHDGGCFSKMGPELEAHEMPMRTDEQTNTSLYFRQILPHCHSMVQSQSQALAFPLLTRGWVYQERLLSPRVLHFGHGEMYWECMQTTACECGDPNGDFTTEQRPPYRHPLINKSKPPKIEHAQALNNFNSRLELHTRWHEIVQEYSSLNLSFEKDIFPALSGLARQMHRHRQADGYIAGLWVSTILFDLLWAAEDDNAPRPRVWRAPSWSWASTTSPVNYGRAHPYAIRETYPQLIRYGRSLVGVDEYGQIERPTFIELEGLLITAHLRYLDGFEGDGMRSTTSTNYEIVIDGEQAGIFDADFALKLDNHEDHVPDGFAVALLLMARSDNNFFYLVLVQVALIVEGQGGSTGNAPVLRERIGLLSRARVYPSIHDTQPTTEARFFVR